MATPILHIRNEKFGERLNAGCTVESSAGLFKNPVIRTPSPQSKRIEARGLKEWPEVPLTPAGGGAGPGAQAC